MNRVAAPRWLAGLLVLQLVLAVLTWWPDRADQPDSGPLLEFVPERIDRIVISDASKTLELSRTAQGWKTAGPGSVPVADARISNALTRLAQLQPGWPIVTGASSHSRLGVAADTFQRQIELYAAGSLQAALLVGTSPGMGQAHVRRPDSDAVFVAPLSTFEWPTTPGDWLDSAALAIPGIRALERGGYRYERQQDGWSATSITANADGAALNAARLDKLAELLTAIRVTGVSDRAVADAPEAALTMTLETPYEAFSLTLAATADEFLLQRSDYDTLFTVGAADYATLLAPPEPEPGASPATADAAAADIDAGDVHQSETG